MYRDRPRRRTGGKIPRFRERLGAYRASRRGLPRRRIPRVAVPSFFTLMNLFSGFLSLTQAFAGRYDAAAWLIVLAAFFDVFDGMAARLTNSNSAFGVELDSLSDIVSFGVAPSFLVFVFGLNEFHALGLVVAALPAICGAIRLARFNTSYDGDKKDYFVGLPIPGQAIILVALILNFDQPSWFLNLRFSNVTLLIPIVFLLSFLMVSSVPFDAFPKPTPQYIRAHPLKFVAYLTGFLLLIVFQQAGLLVALTVYLLQGIGKAIYDLVQAVMNYPVEGASGDEPAA